MCQTNAKSTSGTTPTATETSKKLQGILFTTTRSGSIPGSDEGNSYERYGDAGGKRLLGPITTAAPAALASISIPALIETVHPRRRARPRAVGPSLFRHYPYLWPVSYFDGAGVLVWIFMWRLFSSWLIFQNMSIAAASLIFLVLSALLWYERPTPGLWLLGSLLLGGGWGIVFLRLITSRK